jgi:hypothetical protein
MDKSAQAISLLTNCQIRRNKSLYGTEFAYTLECLLNTRI